MKSTYLTWFGIARLGLVQTSLGAIVVLATSVMNRVMVVELALPAVLPGALVALHYAVQLLRPRLGYGSDQGGQKSRWIIGGVATLAVGGIGAACATALMRQHLWSGVGLGIVSFVMIGLGVGAAGTSLLVLLAKRTEPSRRPVAATVVWLMMIAGFVLTTVVAGRALDPFTPARLIEVTAVVAALALAVTIGAIWGIEERGPGYVLAQSGKPTHAMPPFRQAFAEVWSEPSARQLTIFIFVSMLAYSAEELILDPFAGTVFGYTPGQSTQLSGALHGGVFIGMLLVAFASSVPRLARLASMRTWMIGGCIASALALLDLALAGLYAPAWPLRESVMALGVANGAFAVSAIGSMMNLAGQGEASREGVRMGLWGAAQGIAFGLGGLFASAASDLAHRLIASRGTAYSAVFLGETALFVCAALVAMRSGPKRVLTLREPRPIAHFMAGAHAK